MYFPGLYLNVAKKVSSIENNFNKNNRNNNTNGSSGSNNKNSSSGNLYVDATAAPYQTIRGNQPVHIHPSSVLFANNNKRLPEYIVYSELLITTKHYMRNVTAVEGCWLMELAPNLFKKAIESS